MAKIVSEEVKVTKQFWQNNSGKLVPLESIEQEDIDRDKFVTKTIEKVKALQAVIIKAEHELSNSIENFLKTDAKKHKLKEWVGNATLTDFSGESRIVRKIGKFMVFDHKLQEAKQIIDECVRKLSGENKSMIIAMVNMAYNVDKGVVDRDAILKLTKIKPDAAVAERWEEACKLIHDSQDCQATKPYLYFQEKNEDKEWVNIVLDFAALGKRTAVGKEPEAVLPQPQTE